MNHFLIDLVFSNLNNDEDLDDYTFMVKCKYILATLEKVFRKRTIFKPE